MDPRLFNLQEIVSKIFEIRKLGENRLKKIEHSFGKAVAQVAALKND
jgi:hypothetical protein